jgi:hypothetical protein
MDINLLSAAIAKMIDDGWRHGEFTTRDHECALFVVKQVQEGHRTSDAQKRARYRDAALAACISMPELLRSWNLSHLGAHRSRLAAAVN